MHIAQLMLAVVPVVPSACDPGAWCVAVQGFESAAFKLSHEMTQLLDPGGTRTSPTWRLFEELVVRGYLAVRAARRAPCTDALHPRSTLSQCACMQSPPSHNLWAQHVLHAAAR